MGGLAIMIGKPERKPKPGKVPSWGAGAESDDADMAEPEQDEDLAGVAADEVLAAVKAEDSTALRDALRAFVKACAASDDESEDAPEYGDD